MNLLRTVVGAVIIGALTIAIGVASGHLSNRFGEPIELEKAGKDVESLPERFGDWELVTTSAMSPEVVETLQCAGYVNRVYRNTKTHETVSLAVIVGPTGPTSVHTPEICYSSRDYTILQAREKLPVHQRDKDSFWSMTLQSKDVNAQRLHVVYAWNAGMGWTAADNPRFSFAGHSKLFKLQMATPIAAETKAQDATSQRFLQDLLPELDATLFASPGAKG